MSKREREDPNPLSRLATPLSKTRRIKNAPSVSASIPIKLKKLESQMVDITNPIRGSIFQDRIKDPMYDFLKPHHKIVHSSIHPSSSQYKRKHESRYAKFHVNPPPTSKIPKVLSITAISLCHADLNIEILKEIHNEEEEISVALNTTPIITKRGDSTRVNYEKFIFIYNTVPFNGIFSNVGSCTGFPTVKMPNQIFYSDDIVIREKEALMGKTTHHVHSNNYMFVCSMGYKDLPFREVQSSSLLDDSYISSTASKCNTVVLHENFQCESLINKLYQTIDSETKTILGDPMLYDEGKFILLTKIQYDDEDPEIIKTTILGPEYRESIRELLDILHKPEYERYEEFVSETQEDKVHLYETTTKDIMQFINHIKDEDTSLKFLDTSCNNIDTPTDLLRKRIDEPFVPTMLLKLQDYFIEMASKKTCVHGGKTKRKKRRAK